MIWGVLVCLILLTAFLSVTLRVSYYQKQAAVSLRIGPVKMILYPPAARPKPAPTTAKRKPPTEKRVPPQRKKTPISVKAMLPTLGKMLVRLGQALKINRLAIRLRLTSDDAAQLAVRYGQIHTALGLLAPLLQKKLPANRGEVEIRPDFESHETSFDFALECSLRVRKILAIGMAFGMDVYKQRKGGQL